MENFILDSFGATIKLTIFLCMIVIFMVKSMQFYLTAYYNMRYNIANKT